jgi:hypothetical protein
MKLIEALEILRRPTVADPEPCSVWRGCGLEPLHMSTFLSAQLMARLPQARVRLDAGVYDDLAGNIRRARRSDADAIAVVIEWPDIDPRLGVRRLSGWGVSDLAEIVAQAELNLDRLGRELSAAATSNRIVCCPPTLPLPPWFPEHPDQSGVAELRLRHAVAGSR